MLEEDTKRCPRCKEVKKRTEFSKDRKRKDSLCCYCKICSNELVDFYRRKNPNKYKETNKKSHESLKITRPFYFWAYQTLYKHKQKGFQINITVEELEDIITKTKYCEICGRELIHGSKRVTELSPTLDRKFNSKIIDKDSIMILCHKCNTGKGTGTVDEHVEYCELIYERFKGRDKK